MSDWQRLSLKEILPVSIPGEWGYEPTGIGDTIVLRAADFTKDCKLRRSIGVERKIPFQKLSTRILKYGDILIEKSGGSPDQPVGRAVFFDREQAKQVYSFSNFLQLLRVSEDYDNKFVHYLLTFLYNSGGVYRYQQQTTGIINLKLEHFLLEEVDVPAIISEQYRIAKILNLIDQTLEKTETLIHKYQQIKSGLMHDLFTRGVTAEGKLRPPREQTPELYKESPVGWIPKDWETGGISSFAKIHNNLRLPLSSEVREGMSGEFPYYGPTGILDYINHYRANGKFVLIGEDGDHFLKSDRVEMTQLVNGKFNVNNHAHLLTGDNGCLTEWIYIYFLHRDITFWLTRQGAGRYKLNKFALENLPLKVPKPEEQKLIIQRVLHIRNTVGSYCVELEKLQNKKSGLMHDLLTGKVQVKVDQKEPAHV